MDFELWRKLPEDTMPHILLRLPWWSIMKFRLVNKAWHSLLSDPTFLRHSTNTRGACDGPCPILSNHKFYYVIVNLDIQTCHIIPRENIIPMDDPEARRFQLQATAGGLFLMQVIFLLRRERFLFNPLNGTRKVLPPVPLTPLEDMDGPWNKLHQPKTWMMVGETGTFRIICLQVKETPAGFAETVLWNIHVYDFGANVWNIYSTDLLSRRLEFCMSITFVSGTLYLMTKSQYGPEYSHRLFRAYSRHMVEMPIGFTDGVLVAQVFQYRGDLMIMTGTKEPRKEPPYHVKLWKYDQLLENWENIVSMPENIVDAFYDRMSAEGGFYFDTEGDICCFANRLDSQYIVLYHFGRNEWWYVSCSDVILNDFERLRVDCRVTFLWQPHIDIFL